MGKKTQPEFSTNKFSLLQRFEHPQTVPDPYKYGSSCDHPFYRKINQFFEKEIVKNGAQSLKSETE